LHVSATTERVHLPSEDQGLLSVCSLGYGINKRRIDQGETPSNSARLCPDPWENEVMPKRNLRIMKKGPYKFAVCEVCNSQFKSSLRYPNAAENEIKGQFDDHKCKPMDISQNALRTVHESTEDR